MEFTGSIQFADESSWLTLTTESDDAVTITVRVSVNSYTPMQEVLSFEVTPNSGIVRLPAGEILRALTDGCVGMVTGSFAAAQGTSSCSYSFSVLPCRKFAYKSLAATIFTTRPAKSPVYEGAEDRLYFYRTSGDVSTYVRFNYLSGNTSSNYKLSPTYYATLKYYDLDISCDTMLAAASAKGLNVSNIASYDVWIEYSGSKSTVYSFDIKRMRLPLKTYKFLGRRGTYEYIHATGKFGRSIESETQVFVTSGIEEELANDSTFKFEQNSGHIDSAGMGAYWLEFLASKERYIIEKDGTEKAIVVDESKTSLTDRAVSSLTFTWHYANPNDTTIDKADVELTGLAISGDSTVNNDDNTAQFSVIYTPSNTSQRGVSWSVVSGSDYATIDGNGKMTVLRGANGYTVKIRATSKENSSVYAEKSVLVIYKAAPVSVTGVRLSRSELSLAVGESETLVATVMPERATDPSVTWQSSNENVATVSQSGLVTAVAAGSAEVSVRTNNGGFTATCALTVAAVVKEYTLTVNCATSGATVRVLEYVAGQSSIRDAVDYTGPMTFKENTTVRVWAYKEGMIQSGMQEILMTSDKTVSIACKTIPTWNLAAESSAGSGGSNLLYEVSDPDSVGWRLVSDVDWISVDSDVVIDVNPNTSSDSRTGHVKLICDAVETDYVAATCEISQSAPEVTVQEPSIEFESDSVSASAESTECTMLYLARNLTGLTVSCSGTLVDATAKVNTSPIETIVVSYAVNTSTSERTGTITVTGTRTDGLGSYSKSFTIVQAAAANADPAEFTVTREAVSGPEWDLVTQAMADEDSALSDFVGWYKSGIAGTTNGVTVTKLTFNVTAAGTVTVEFFSDAESSYDYLVAAAMDESTELTKTNADTLAEVTTKGNQGIANKITKTYDLTVGTHTLQILYRKDGSRDEGTDSGYYRVLSESSGSGDDPFLPDGYTALDHIASKGTSGSLTGDLPYIDTGIINESNQTYHVEYTVFPNSETGLSQTTYPFIMGSCSNSKSGTTVKQIHTGNFPGEDSSYGTTGMTGDQSGAWGGNRSGGNCIVLFGVLAPGERHTLEWNYDQRFVSVDGDEASGKIVGSSSTTVGTSNSCYLFAVNMAGSYVDGNGIDRRRGWQKLHRFWIKDSAGALLCDLYPCRNEDGVYGLYDMVGGTFLTSANDKTFTGPDDE